jgi:hypothetical protein
MHNAAIGPAPRARIAPVRNLPSRVEPCPSPGRFYSLALYRTYVRMRNLTSRKSLYVFKRHRLRRRRRPRLLVTGRSRGVRMLQRKAAIGAASGNRLVDLLSRALLDVLYNTLVLAHMEVPRDKLPEEFRLRRLVGQAILAGVADRAEGHARSLLKDCLGYVLLDFPHLGKERIGWHCRGACTRSQPLARSIEGHSIVGGPDGWVPLLLMPRRKHGCYSAGRFHRNGSSRCTNGAHDLSIRI